MKHPRGSRRRQLGVSLIEALVAFGVMSFGMMAVVGMQATLRTNGDMARQRSEAVRIAQDALETWRGFTTLPATANRMAYADISSVATSDIAGENATYQLTRQVNPEPTVEGTFAAQRRTLVVDVGWLDRSGQPQNVRMASTVAGIEPELAASLALASNPDPIVQPLGRQRGIPAGAVQLGSGRSGYVPPGQTGSSRVAWVFNNTSGVITLCTTTGTTSADLLFSGSAPSCGSDLALLLSGVVRYATDVDPASSSTSVADPVSSDRPAFGLTATQTIEGTPSTVDCYQQPLIDNAIQYFCAMRISGTIPNWTGYLSFTSPLDIAGSVSSASPSNYKVCRYHAGASYTAVATPLLSQNYVIIKAGLSGTAYQCPTTSTPRTWAHQPT